MAGPRMAGPRKAVGIVLPSLLRLVALCFDSTIPTALLR